MRRHSSTVLKIGITVVGLIFVLLAVPAGEVADVMVDVQWIWVAIAFVMVLASLVLRAFRWNLLLRGLDVVLPFGRLVELYFVGNFFNAFLPSGFGGDAVRIFEVARDVPANIAAGTVLVDRLTGLIMLFVMALMALPFRPDDFPTSLALVIASVSIAGLGASFVLLEGSLIKRLASWLPEKLSPVGDGPVAQLMSAVQGCGWRAIGGALLISGLFNLLLVGWWAMAGRALGLDVPYRYYLLVVPLLSVALLIPSIGGLGVRESMAPLLFASASVSRPEAVALSLLVFIIMRAASLLGAPVYIISTLRENRKRATESALSDS